MSKSKNGFLTHSMEGVSVYNKVMTAHLIEELALYLNNEYISSFTDMYAGLKMWDRRERQCVENESNNEQHFGTEWEHAWRAWKDGLQNLAVTEHYFR